MRLFVSCVFLLLIAVPVLAQTALTGTVSDAKTNEPLPFVTVYVAGTTQGTLTDSTGRFRLANLPVGAVPLVVSMVGYRAWQQTITVSASATAIAPAPLTIRLIALTNVLDEAVVKARRDKTWERQLTRFSGAFFGDSPNRAQCTVQNPWVIDFTESGGTLSATAQQPLLIENRAAGYQIRYDLREFAISSTQFRLSGSAYFLPLKPQRDSDANRWNRTRQQTYDRSLRAFLRAFVANELMANGFTAYPASMDVLFKYSVWNKAKPYLKSTDLITNTETYLKPGSMPGTYRLQLPPLLDVTDTRRYVTLASQGAFNQNPSSWLRPLKPVVEVGADGWLTDPAALETIGYWAEERVAEMLPREYAPGVVPSGKAVAGAANDGPYFPEKQGVKPVVPVVYVATSKEAYRAGERVWFSAFISDRSSRHLLTGPQPLYVQLYNAAGQQTHEEVIFTDNGRGTGALLLPDSLAGGLYRLRAFTRQMLTAPTLTFEKILAVSNLREPRRYRLLPVSTERSPTARSPTERGPTARSPTLQKALADTLGLTIVADRPTYQRREKITFTVRATAVGQPVWASFAVAVTDAAQVDSPQTSLNTFWQQPPVGKFGNNALPETGLRYGGTVRTPDGSRAMPRATITLFDELHNAAPRTLKTDNAGRFVLDSLDFDGTLTLRYQISNRKGHPELMAELLAEPLLPYQTLTPLAIDPACVVARPMVDAASKTAFTKIPADGEPPMMPVSETTTEETAVTADNQPKDDQTSAQRLHNESTFGVNFDENTPRYPNVMELMTGRLPGVSVMPASTGVGYNVLIRGIGTVNDLDPLFLLDGTPVDFKNDRSLSFIDANSVRRIEVLSGGNGAIYGSRAGNGVIAIYTGRKSGAKDGLKTIELNGYQAPSTFITPDYGQPPAIDRPDNRQTLYWNPAVTTATDGTATVSFYVADRPGQYRIVVEGMNSTGLVGVKTVLMEVK